MDTDKIEAHQSLTAHLRNWGFRVSFNVCFVFLGLVVNRKFWASLVRNLAKPVGRYWQAKADRRTLKRQEDTKQIKHSE